MKLRIPIFLLAFAASACGATKARTPAENAEDAYRTEHLACVAKFHTDPEIDQCRAEVRAKWGVPPRDAGASEGKDQ